MRILRYKIFVKGQLMYEDLGYATAIDYMLQYLNSHGEATIQSYYP